MKKTLVCLLCGAAGSALLGSAAFAQTAPSSSDKAIMVGEVVVTASKRTERLQDVPSSVTAVTGDSLKAIGATRLEDYVAQVPGLVLSDTSGANGFGELSIRGVTTGFGGNPTVGVYIDDSPYGPTSGPFSSASVPDFDPQELSRVEVLEGPQGTLYGGGSLGGLVKFVTTQPDPTHLYGRVEVDGSDVDGGGAGYGVRGSVNVPLNDQMAVRVSAYDRQDPGFIDDPVTGARDLNSGHVYGGRAAFAWNVNNNWKVRLSGLVQDQTSAGSSTVDYNTTTFQPIYGERDQDRLPESGQSRFLNGAVNLEVEGDLGWATLTSATSYNKQEFHINLDETSEIPLGIPNSGTGATTAEHADKFSQEIRLASPSTDTLSWQVGGFYTYEHTPVGQFLPVLNATTGRPLVPGSELLYDAKIDEVFQEYAVFGDLTYRFNAYFDVTGGVRYSQDRISQNEFLAGIAIGPVSETIPGGSHDKSTTFLVTPRFHLNKDTMVYLRVATGFRPGGPNLAVPGALAEYGPDSVTNYEAGVKTDLLDKRVSLDIATFYIDWKNIQLNEQGPTGNFTGNAGAAKSEGVEASGSWRPIHGLSITGNVSYTDAQLAAVLPQGGGLFGGPGDELPGSARWRGALNADYEFPLYADWTGVAGASYRYIGQREGQFAPSSATPRWTLPAYDVLDLRLGVKKDQWSATAYIKNVGDSLGQVDNSVAGAVTRVSIIQPRTFGFSVARNF